MLEIVLSGVGGGLSIEALLWWSKRETFHIGLPAYARSYAYWISTAVMITLGGVLVFLYQKSGMDLKPIVAFNLGASTPSILSALSKAAPPKIDV